MKPELESKSGFKNKPKDKTSKQINTGEQVRVEIRKQDYESWGKMKQMSERYKNPSKLGRTQQEEKTVYEAPVREMKTLFVI